MRIYHTSDLHDHRHIVAPLERLRAAHPGLLVDCGDSLRGSQTMYHRREPVIDVIDAAHYDVQAMGNREFHYLFGAVRARIGKMQHPVVCANLVDTKQRALPFTADYRMQYDDNGEPWTFRFFGLLVPQYPVGAPWERVFGWRFLDPYAVAAEIAAATPDGVTLVALSHIGLRADRELARRVPRLDLILGGHSHDTLHEPEIVDGVPIVHAGPYGAFASRTDLAHDGTRTRVIASALERLT